MSDVLLGQSYYLRFDPKLLQLMQPYPPLGTLIAAACLRRRGYRVELFDAMLADSESEWEAALERHRPRVAVLYEDNFNYLSKMCLLRMREAAFTMLEAAQRRGCTTIVSGSDASDHPEEYLDRGAEAVIVGEGEETLVALMDRLDGRSATPLEQIAGLAFRGNSGEVVRAPARAVIKDLEALPEPAWDLVDVPRYRDLWQRQHGYYSMNLVTTRGCPFHCNWCAKPIWGQTYHVREPAGVAAEQARLKQQYRPDHIWFADDILGLRPGWMARFAEELAARDARLDFKCQSRVDLLLRDGEIDAFRRAGAHTVWVGAESGSQRILDAMEKGTCVAQIRAATERLHAAGIRVGFFLQFGFPGEEWADIEATRRMVQACRPDEIGISVSYPLPGTKFYEGVQQQLSSKQNWVDSDDLDMMFVGTYTTDFYRRLYRVVHKEFRARRAAGTLRARLRRPASLSRSDARLAAAGLWHRVTLPWERLRLRALRRPSGTRIDGWSPALTPEQAGVPTPEGPE